MFPSIGSAGRRFAFLHRVLRGEFPCFTGTIKALRLPAAHPAVLRYLRLAVPRCHSLCSLLGGRVTAEAWSWSPGSSSRDVAEETAGSPKFLGNPKCPFAHVQSTPAGPLAPDHYGAAAWPLVCEKQRLPRKVFRRSIAWPSDSLSTLRSAGYPDPRKTRFRPLVRRYRTGFHPQGSDERFQRCFTSHPPFPSCLAQSHRPHVLRRVGPTPLSMTSNPSSRSV